MRVVIVLAVLLVAAGAAESATFRAYGEVPTQSGGIDPVEFRFSFEPPPGYYFPPLGGYIHFQHDATSVRVSYRGETIACAAGSIIGERNGGTDYYQVIALQPCSGPPFAHATLVLIDYDGTALHGFSVPYPPTSFALIDETEISIVYPDAREISVAIRTIPEPAGAGLVALLALAALRRRAR